MPTREEMIRDMKRQDMIAEMRAMDAAPKAVEEDKVNDEMPSWLQSGDRSVVKNLASDHGEAITYLQKQYPDAEFKASGSDILARKRGESVYGKLDPSFSPISNPVGTIKDLWNDTKDLGYDAVQGAGEAIGGTVGAVGGGVAGALTANPAGVAAGMAAGGVLGAGAGAGAASTLKQMLRMKYGLSDSMDGGEIAKDATLGAVVPMAFSGIGKAVKYGAQKVAPKAYGWAVGKSPEFLKQLALKGDDISTRSSDEALGAVEGLQKEFGEGVGQKIEAATQKYNAVTGSDGSLDVSPIVKDVDDYIANLSKAAKDNPNSGVFKEQLKQALKFRTKEIGPTGLSPKKMQLEYVQKMRNALNDNYLPTYKEDIGQMVGKGVSSVEEKLAGKVRDGLLTQADSATSGALGAANGEWAQLNRIADFGRDYLGTPKKTTAFLKTLSDGTDDVALGRFQRLPKELQEQIIAGKDEKVMFDYLKGINTKRILSDDNVGSAVVNAVGGKSPIEKMLTLAGGAIGTSSGAGYPGMLAGLTVGRGLGKLVASPKSVLVISKTARQMGITAEELAKRMEQNPWLMQSVLGASAAATIE